ncbi:hypothetical protein, partial [Methylobacterium hispanicum]
LYGSLQAVKDAVAVSTGARDTAVAARDTTRGYRDASEDFAERAEAAAASAEAVSGLPLIGPGDRGRVLAVKPDGSGTEWSNKLKILALASL